MLLTKRGLDVLRQSIQRDRNRYIERNHSCLGNGNRFAYVSRRVWCVLKPRVGPPCTDSSSVDRIYPQHLWCGGGLLA